MSNPPTLTAISAVGAKGPACFLLEAGGKRLMLDLGYGPQPGLWPDLDDVGRVDALVLSHSHKDHIGGLSLLPKIGNPLIFATEATVRRLPAGTEANLLSIHGEGDVLGIRVETGRNGHAPGGIWMRFHGGTGLLYTGDYSTESALYAYDEPPKARTVLLDASYGDDDTPIAERQRALAPFLAGDVLLPAPDDGRGPDLALHLHRAGRPVQLDAATRQAMRELAGPHRACLRPGLESELAQIADGARPPGDTAGATIAAPAACGDGATAELIAQWENKGEPAIVLTGYIPPGTPADRLARSGRAKFLRWNVHPRLSDNVALVRASGAATVIPAFCDRKFLPALKAALRPANVTMDAVVTLS
jgi:Cft2 family RNA processing exonuclease